MNKRFNIRAAFEEAKEAADAAQLEVDKEAALTPEEKALRDSALQLASATDESEGAKPAEDKGTTDTPPVADETPTPTEEPVSTDEVAPVAGEEPEAEEGTDADTDKTEEVEPTPEPTEEPKEGDDAEPTDAPADVDDAPDLDLDNPDDVPVDPESEEGKEKAKDNEEDKEQEKDAVKVAASLESIANIMQRSLDKGGLTPMSAQATALVLGQLYNRVGLTYKPAAFPAMESYGSVSSRKRNTELALEGVTQAIENVWVAIKKSIARACAKIRETARMFAYYFRTIEGQIKSIRSILPKLSKDKTERLYSSNRDISNLSVGEKFDVLTVIKEVTSLTDAIKTKLLPKAISDLKTLTATLKLDKSKVDIKEIPRVSLDIKDFTPFTVTTNRSSEVDTTCSSSKPFLGRYVFEATLPKPSLDTESFQGALVSASVTLQANDVNQEVKQQALSEKGDIGPLLDHTQVLVTKMYEFWNSFSKVEREFTNIEDMLDNSSNTGVTAATYVYGKNSLGSTVIGPIVDKAIEENRDRLNSTVKKQVILSVKAVERTYIDFSITISNLAYKTAASAIHYANASAKAYM